MTHQQNTYNYIYNLQSVKILLVPPKCEIIVHFSNINLIFICFTFGIKSLLLFMIALPKVIALRNSCCSLLLFEAIVKRLTLLMLSPKIATTIAVAIVGRAITIWEAMQKISHEPIYRTDTKNETKRLRTTMFAFKK